MDFGTLYFISQNGGDNDRWNMRINVDFVTITKTLTFRVVIIYACLRTVRCVENIHIKENVFVTMNCYSSCLNEIVSRSDLSSFVMSLF